MSSPLGSSADQSDPFAPTHWSVILAAGQSDSDPARARLALEQLCQTYWTPLYTFVRSRGFSVHDAQDLTQGFFAHLIENEIYTRVDRERGKFRSFLLASLKNFMANAYAYSNTLKRGGGQEVLPLEEGRVEAAESLFQTHSASKEPNNEDQLFERSWAEALIQTSLERLAAEYQSDGKEDLFRQLRPFLTGGPTPLPTYHQLAEQTGLPAPTLRSHVTRLRKRYREMLRAEVRQTVKTESEVDEELHELFRVLTRG